MMIDSIGHFPFLIFAILAITTIAGAAIKGKTAYDNGVRGWELFGEIALGATLGLAAGGALIALSAGIFAAGSALAGGAGINAIFLGVAAKQAFAIGALAYNFFAFVVAPIIGVAVEGIEYGGGDGVPDNLPKKPQPAPRHPAGKLFGWWPFAKSGGAQYYMI